MVLVQVGSRSPGLARLHKCGEAGSITAAYIFHLLSACILDIFLGSKDSFAFLPQNQHLLYILNIHDGLFLDGMMQSMVEALEGFLYITSDLPEPALS